MMNNLLENCFCRPHNKGARMFDPHGEAVGVGGRAGRLELLNPSGPGGSSGSNLIVGPISGHRPRSFLFFP